MFKIHALHAGNIIYIEVWRNLKHKHKISERRLIVSCYRILQENEDGCI
jgi:hypothetical protein